MDPHCFKIAYIQGLRDKFLGNDPHNALCGYFSSTSAPPNKMTTGAKIEQI